MPAYTDGWIGNGSLDDSWTNAANWTVTDPATLASGAIPDGQGDVVTFIDATPGVVNSVVIPDNPVIGGVLVPWVAINALSLDGPADGGGYQFRGGELRFEPQSDGGASLLTVSTDAVQDDFVTLALYLDDNLNLDTTSAAAKVAFGATATIEGPGGLDVMGSGTVDMDGAANSYAGGTVIAGGWVSLGNVDALGAGGGAAPLVDFEGGSLESRVTGLLPNAIRSGAAVATLAATDGNTLTLGGPVSWTGTLAFGTALDQGAIVLAPSALGASAGALMVAAGTLKVGNSIGASEVGAATGVTVGTSAIYSALDLDGFALSLANLSGDGAGVVENTGAAATLTLVNTANSSFAGDIEDGAGAIALAIQSNGGALTLTGRNAFSGGATLLAHSALVLGDDNAVPGLLTLDGDDRVEIASGVNDAAQTTISGLTASSRIQFDGFDSAAVVTVAAAAQGEVATITDGAKSSSVTLLSDFTQTQLGVLVVTAQGVALSPNTDYSAGGYELDVGGNGRSGPAIAFKATDDTVFVQSASDISASGADDVFNGSDDTLALTGAQLTVNGHDDAITLGSGAGASLTVDGGADAVRLTGAGATLTLGSGAAGWDTATGDDDTLDIAGADASFVGGGDAIHGAGAWVASLYQTNNVWDSVYGSNGDVALTGAQASVVGGGDRLWTFGACTLSLYDTAGNWDALYGSDDSVAMTSAQASLVGGGETVWATGGSAVSLYQTAGNWDSVYGSSETVALTNAQASLLGGDDRIWTFGACSVSLYETGGAWDTVFGSDDNVALTGAQSSLVGGGDTIWLAGGSTVSLYQTGGSADAVYGSGEAVAFTNAQGVVNGTDDAIYLFGADSVTLQGGSDNLCFTAAFGQQSVSGFSASDILDLSAADWSSFAALQSSGDLEQSSANAVLSFGSGNAITLLGVNVSTLGAGNFAFK